MSGYANTETKQNSLINRYEERESYRSEANGFTKKHACAQWGYRSAFVFSLLCVMASHSWAQPIQNRPDLEFDDTEKPWQEVAVQFPKTPSDADLLTFDVNKLSDLRFAVDAKSLSLGRDDVVRYTLVAMSPSGAKNISYEGLRCSTRERRIYALGHPDGSWSKARNSDWVRILSNVMNRQQATLADEYFCTSNSTAGDTKDMLQRLRRHETLKADFSR